MPYCCAILLLVIQVTFSQIFLPVADTDNQSDAVSGTNPSLNISRYCTPFLKFDLSSGPDSVGMARLRLYYQNGIPACSLFISATNNETWVEGGAKPAVGTLIRAHAFPAASAGYVELDLTDFVKTRMTGSRIISIAVSSNQNGWTPIHSREAAANPPELAVAGSGGNPFAVTGITLSLSRAFVYTGRAFSLSSRVIPDNALDTVITWSSDNSAVAEVDATGRITGKTVGRAVITVTSRDGGKKAACEVIVRNKPANGTMSPGCNFWNIGWENYPDFFRTGVDWSTVSNPWNPLLLSELQQAGMTCLRFMDWNVVNYSCVRNWAERIPKTANHYNSGNTVPCFTDRYDDSSNTHTLTWSGQTHFGVAVEWQIDLCNRVGADLWINIPATATLDFQRQLARLIKDQLDSSLHVYVEWANEVWNWGFTSTVYARDKADSLRLDTLNYGGAFMMPWRAYTVYASVRAFEQFESVFGRNSPRLIKVLAGQVAYHWAGYNYNHMVTGDLAALANPVINPNGTTINAYAMAPYMGGSSLSAQRTALESDSLFMLWAKNSLAGTSIKLICYEAGADNYPDQGLTLTRDPEQEILNRDYLALLDNFCQGPINQYCMYGGCWGLKNYPGEAEANAPKWRGWLDYWGGWAVSTGAETFAGRSLATGKFIQRISPNPASEAVDIKLLSGKSVRITLVNVRGQTLLQYDMSKPHIRISLAPLPPGLYFVKITGHSRTDIEKLVILR